MSDIFAMQRANGDWFALDHHGRLRVPLFHSSRDAMIARSRNFGLLVFKPVVLNARFLAEILPLPGEDEVDFCMVDDPFTRLSRSRTLGRAQLASVIGLVEDQSNGRNGNTPVSGLGKPLQSDSEATETWRDEGGTYENVPKAT